MKHKTISELLSEYEQYHQNKINIRCHWVGIPLIIYGLFGLMLIASPTALLVFIIAMLAYYGFVARYLAIGAVVATGIMCVLVFITALTLSWPDLPWYGVMFVLGWALQFLGHRIEGTKPAFLRDLRFLAVGPLWLLVKIYRHYGWQIE